MKKEDWESHPKIVVQKTLLYGGIQSEVLLELVLWEMASSLEDGKIKDTVLYQQLVDNILGYYRSVKKKKLLAGKVDEVLSHHNLAFKRVFDTTKEHSESSGENFWINLG